MMKFQMLSCLILSVILMAGCTGMPAPQENGSGDADRTNAPGHPVETDRPKAIADLMKERGDQDKAKPELIVESPRDGAVISSSTVKVKVRIGGDLKGLVMGKDKDGKGNHVHVILDNQPYAAHYKWNEGFELRNVKDGDHILRLFPSRPWHESYKNEKAFKTVAFTVRSGEADEAKPTTDDKGQTVAEGVSVGASEAGDVDLRRPLLTYSRPKGVYKGGAAKAIMIDFWLSNAKLAADGGKYWVRFSIDGGKPGLLVKWEPVWFKDFDAGEHRIKVELIDKDGTLVENGGYNSTTRTFTVEP